MIADKNSTCFGDSGGPLAVINDDESSICVWYRIIFDSCLKGNPNVFTRVSHFLNWIADQSSEL